jgi:hypothetical protein
VISPVVQPHQEAPKKGAPAAVSPREGALQRGERAPSEVKEKKVWKVTTPENAVDKNTKEKERKAIER